MFDRLRRAPGVPQARHITERAVAPYLRADLTSLRADLVDLAGALHASSNAHHGTAGEVQAALAALRELNETVTALDRHMPAVLSSIASTNGSTRLLRREFQRAKAETEESVALEIAKIADVVEEQRAAILDLQRRLGTIDGVSSDDVTAVTELERSLGAISQAVSTHASMQAWLLSRVETVRNEVLYEMRYGPPSSGPREAEPEIVNPAALYPADGQLRLNLGCGQLPLTGYVNIDIRRLDGVDVVASVDNLPVEAESVSEVFSAHVIEHFPEEDLLRRLLPYCRTLLRPGGCFRAVTPDIGAMIAGFERSEIPFEQLRAAVYGGQEYEGDFHFTGFTVTSVSDMLERSGFVEVSVTAQARPNGDCLELEVCATRPLE